jgi:hypothetical protein
MEDTGILEKPALFSLLLPAFEPGLLLYRLTHVSGRMCWTPVDESVAIDALQQLVHPSLGRMGLPACALPSLRPAFATQDVGDAAHTRQPRDRKG